MNSEILKYLIWTFGELEPERNEDPVVCLSVEKVLPEVEKEPKDYSLSEPPLEFNEDQTETMGANSQRVTNLDKKSSKNLAVTLASLNGLPTNEFFFEEIISQFNREFETFFSNLLNGLKFPFDRELLKGLKSSIYNFYLCLILPDIKALVGEKKIIRQKGNNHPEIKKLLMKIFFLTGLTYEVMSGNIVSLKHTFNRIPGKKIKENRMLSYIMVTRLVESEGLSERLSIRKLSDRLSLFDQDQDDIDHDKYENFVKAYNKWKNENPKYFYIILEDIRNGMSDENILQKIRTLTLN